MIKNLAKKGFVFIILATIFLTGHPQLTVTFSLCENKINPAGIPLTGAHFSWVSEAKDYGQFQKAYQLVVASSLAGIQQQKYDGRNSSVVHSNQSLLVQYKGKKLRPAQVYYWCVRVWDKNDKASEWGKPQSFITGLFNRSDWSNASWIGFEELPDSMIVSPGIHQPDANSLGNKCMQRPVTPLFRKQFTAEKAIRSAIVFVTGLGQYELSINGKKVGNSFLSPGWTYYEKRCLYNTYDVTGLVRSGLNAIGIIAGNGFYNINRERYYKIVSAFGMPKVICKLKIVYTDGTIENIVSGSDWKTSPAAITFNSIYGGEDYDARLEQCGWDDVEFEDSKWKNAILVKPPKGRLEPEMDYPLKVCESFAPVKILRPDPNIFIYDFGQNLSGIIELKVRGKKGQTIKLTPAELLSKDQFANQRASGSPFYFSYTLKGNGIEDWQPKFTYYGFRYVQLEGALPDSLQRKDSLPAVIALTSLHTRNSTPENGSFECSNTLFNRINELIKWAVKSNIQSVITDCPHREKLSWLEQDYLMGASIHYNYDIYLLYTKLVKDMMDAQTNEGLVPDIAPEFVEFGNGFRDSPEWGSAAVILPWLIYTWYGDKEIIQQAYPMMKKYIAYLEKKSTGNLLSHGLGDWYDYGPNFPGEAQLTPKAVTATSIYYYDINLLSTMADLLNDKEEVFRLNKLSGKVKSAFNAAFFNPQSKVYSTGSQTAMSMPLCVGLVNEKYRKAVLKPLVDSIRVLGKKLTAGDIGFHFLIKALDDGGQSQIIFDMNFRDDVAGYGFQLKKGATALTESWAALDDVSNNHLMLGHIMEWFYSGLAGISQAQNSVAYKDIIIRPEPVGDITFVNATYDSPYGPIKSDWKKDTIEFELTVSIPVNATATIYLPATRKNRLFESGTGIQHNSHCRLVGYNNGKAIIKVGSGTYQFKVK